MIILAFCFCLVSGSIDYNTLVIKKGILNITKLVKHFQNLEKEKEKGACNIESSTELFEAHQDK